jgi:hypothetical protein
MRAAGLPPISTVADPCTMLSGGPTQTAMSPKQAAGIPPMSTVGAPGGRIGPPTCGTGSGFTIGQTCISVIRAAGGMISGLPQTPSERGGFRKRYLRAYFLSLNFLFLFKRFEFQLLNSFS